MKKSLIILAIVAGCYLVNYLLVSLCFMKFDIKQWHPFFYSYLHFSSIIFSVLLLIFYRKDFGL